MGSFYDVTAGNATLAADVNQFSDRLNGVTGAQVKHLSQNNATSALQALLSSAPTTDQSVFDVQVSGDANARVSAYIRSADGYGGLRAGAGPGVATAHLYAQSFGWQILEDLHVAGAITGGSLWSTSGIHSAGGVAFDNGAFSSDGAGHVSAVSATLTSITVNGPPILAAGHQETGACGADLTGAAAGQSQGYKVNFKTTLANAPTSITLTVTTSGNVTGAGVNQLSKDGFLFFITAAVSGTMFWYGSYVTVGNCLLAVDSAAQTFDHHCDGCAPEVAVSRGLPLTALHVMRDHRGLSVAYICPRCGTSEHFTTTLIAADETDTTPQGIGEFATTRGTQAALIRRLMTLLALPLA